MNIITKGTIGYYCDHFPMAKTALLAWYHQFSKQLFRSFNDLKAVYGNASLVGNSRVIFNIKGNDYRLITSVNFRRSAAYVIWFGPHKTYDRVNAATVPFDIRILDYKNNLP